MGHIATRKNWGKCHRQTHAATNLVKSRKILLLDADRTLFRNLRNVNDLNCALALRKVATPNGTRSVGSLRKIVRVVLCCRCRQKVYLPGRADADLCRDPRPTTVQLSGSDLVMWFGNIELVSQPVTEAGYVRASCKY